MFHRHLAAAARGEPISVEVILGSIRPWVIRYCRARLGRIDQTFARADGVAKQVCGAVLTRLPTHADQGAPFLAVVFGIARHEVTNVHHATGRTTPRPHPDVPISPHSSGEPDRSLLPLTPSAQMTDLLGLLPEPQREVLILRLIIGLSLQETAEAIGSRPAKVRITQHRALAHLRRALT